MNTAGMLIALAMRKGTIQVKERKARSFNGTVFTIYDEHGFLEVHLTREEVDARLAEISNIIQSRNVSAS